MMAHRNKPVLFALTLAFSWGCGEDNNQDPDNGIPEGETGGSDEGDAEFSVDLSLSPAISTVGIVEWSTIHEPIEEAVIELGPDTDYRWTAPVDLDEENYRTLLLGMKPASEYHLRIVAKGGGTTYTSDDYTIETGGRTTSLPNLVVTTEDASRLAGGFMVVPTYIAGWTFILDEDVEPVWWFRPEGGENAVRSRLSYDGKWMINANSNMPGPSNGTLSRVSMDGLVEEMYDVPGRHHDVEVLPDGAMVLMEYESSGAGTCDRIVEMTPDGDIEEIFMVRDHFSHRATDGDWCHSNAINYLPDEDAYTLSILRLNSIIKLNRSGELIWVFGGEDSDFPGIRWAEQHQHQLLEDGILLFNNGGESGGGVGVPSRALEYAMDEADRSASLVWEYDSGSLNSMAMGDAKRLPNGNTLVVFSAAGTIQEVSPEGELLREIAYPMGNSLGYVEWRSSLYGPPEQYL
jgi:hypothetical protein